MNQEETYYKSIEEPSSIELPSQKQNSKSPKKKKKSLKWGIILTIIVLLYIFYTPLVLYFESILEQNPTLYSYYLYIQGQISNLTLVGLFFFSILGSLFFLMLPSEATFLYYLSNTDHIYFFVVLFALLGNIVGMTINYLFGRLIGQKLLKFFFGVNEFYKYKEGIDKYGGYLLLIGNIIPGPIEFIAVFYGGFKFSLSRYIYLVTMGRLIKYLLLLIAFIFYWDSIIYLYNGFLEFFIQLFNIG